MLEEVLTALGLKKAATIGGLLGSLISLKFLPVLNIWQGATTLFCGWMIAAHATPVVMWALDMSDKNEGGVGFLLGVIGMSVIGNLLKAMPEWVQAAKNKFFEGGGD